jgi:hypothetical protein
VPRQRRSKIRDSPAGRVRAVPSCWISSTQCCNLCARAAQFASSTQ